jgi:hypothetical protein
MGSYFPDFALKTSTTNIGVNGTNDSAFFFVTIPAVKLYTDTAQFSASVLPVPGTGTFNFTFLNKTTPATQNNITTFPDSIRMRIKTAGGVPTGNYTLTINGKGPNGTPVHVRNVNINVGFIGLHNNNTRVPDKFYLYQNYPNPFNPNTNIKFDIVKTGMVKLTVYDITGQVINTLVEGQLTPGSYSYDFKASDLSSGIYFYKIEAPDL